MAETASALDASTSWRRLGVADDVGLRYDLGVARSAGHLLGTGADVTVDLSAVRFIDSTALSVLHMHNESPAAGGRLIVTNPSPVVVRILHLAGLLTLLDIRGCAE